MEQRDDLDRSAGSAAPAVSDVSTVGKSSNHLGCQARAMLSLIGGMIALMVIGWPVLMLILQLPSSRPYQVIQVSQPTRPVLLIGPDGVIVTPQPTPRIPATVDPERDRHYRETHAVDRLNLVEMYIESESYPAAVIELDAIIELRQDLSQAYYLRALCFYKMNQNLRNLNEALDYNQRGVADIDQAIRLEPDNGEFYYIRYRLYETLSNLYEYRADSSYLYAIALENLKIANQLGNADELTPRYQVQMEFGAGECEQGFVDWQKLNDALPPNEPSAGLNTILAAGLLICRADYAGALEHVETAIQIKPSTERTWLRTMLLYHAGRPQDALEALNQSITEKPNFSGYRYYLRALIHYELGNRAQAEQDLLTGSGSTWGQGGLALYVQAHLALDDGDREEGIRLLKAAEATMPGWLYTPFIERCQRELADLGAQPLERQANVPYQSTPMVLP